MMLVQTLLLFMLANSQPDSPSKVLKEDVPLEFRCDGMQVFSKPNNRTLCKTNVVLRRGDLLLCCDFFEGFANDQWEWQRFVCKTDVRAQRNLELMWSNRAEFVLANSELVLTGKPLLHRGKSVLTGSRIIVDVKEDHARIEKPKASIQAEKKGPEQTSAKPATNVIREPAFLRGPLPVTCPLPARSH